MFLYPEDDCQADNEDDHAHGEETPVQGGRGFQKDATWEQFNKKYFICKMVLFKSGSDSTSLKLPYLSLFKCLYLCSLRQSQELMDCKGVNLYHFAMKTNML